MIHGAYQADRTASAVTDFTRDPQRSNDAGKSGLKEECGRPLPAERLLQIAMINCETETGERAKTEP
jgi:hypothetical protein